MTNGIRWFGVHNLVYATTTTPIFSFLHGRVRTIGGHSGSIPMGNFLQSFHHSLLRQKGLYPGARAPELLQVQGIQRTRYLQTSALPRKYRRGNPFLLPRDQCLAPRTFQRPIHPSLCVATANQRTPRFGKGIQKDILCVMSAVHPT